MEEFTNKIKVLDIADIAAYAEKLMKSAKPMVIKSCPYLLPCGFCDKRNGEMCSQYK